MATKVILFVALAALLSAISAQGLSRVSGTYNGRYYDYKRYPSTGLPRGYDDDMGLDRVSGTYNGKYYDYSRYPTTGRSDRYYDDDMIGLDRVSSKVNKKYYGMWYDNARSSNPQNVPHLTRKDWGLDDDMDAFKLKKLGSLAKKGFKAYQTYKKYTSGGFDDDMDEFKLKKLGSLAKKGFKAYQTYKKYTGGLVDDDERRFQRYTGPIPGIGDDDERIGRPCICVRAPCPCDSWDDDMDAFKLKKLGSLAKKGLKAYQTYKKYTGGLVDDDEQIDTELAGSISYNNGPWSATINHDFGTRRGSAQGSYNQGPWNIGVNHNWDDDELFGKINLKKIGQRIDQGINIYNKYKDVRDALRSDDDELFGKINLKKIGQRIEQGINIYNKYKDVRDALRGSDDDEFGGRFGGNAGGRRAF